MLAILFKITECIHNILCVVFLIPISLLLCCHNSNLDGVITNLELVTGDFKALGVGYGWVYYCNLQSRKLNLQDNI